MIGGIPHMTENLRLHARITQLSRKNQQLEETLRLVLNRFPEPDIVFGHWIMTKIRKALDEEPPQTTTQV